MAVYTDVVAEELAGFLGEAVADSPAGALSLVPGAPQTETV